MLEAEPQEFVRRIPTNLRIIVGALAFGVLVFAVVVLMMTPEDEQKEVDLLLPTIAACATPLALVAAVAVPRFLRNLQRQKLVTGEWTPRPQHADEPLSEVGSLAMIYYFTSIIGGALLEGPAFLNLVAFMLERQTINLACAAALLIGLFFIFPSRDRFENWIRDQQKIIGELRSLGSR